MLARQVQTVRVHAGHLEVRTAGQRRRVFAEGASFVVPAGSFCAWRNAGTDLAHVTVDVEPAGNVELLLEQLAGLSRDGKLDELTGLPSRWLQTALLVHDVGGVYVDNGLPSLVQNFMYMVAAPIARLLSLRSCYPQYSDSCVFV